jgi:hypothetical protein
VPRLLIPGAEIGHPPELMHRLLPLQFRLIKGLMDVVTLSLDGRMAVQLRKRRRL